MTHLHNALCPICGEGTLQRETSTHTHTYKGHTRCFDNYLSYRCSKCGEDIVNAKDNAEIMSCIIDFQREIDGLLSPKEIKMIRENLGFTQEALAKTLGVGKKTFARYESGSVTQSVIMDRFLRVIHKVPQALDALHP